MSTRNRTNSETRGRGQGIGEKKTLRVFIPFSPFPDTTNKDFSDMGIPRVGFDRALKRLYDVIDGVLNPASDGDSYVGAIPSVTGLTVSEDGFGPYRRTVLKFTNVAFTLTDVPSTVAYSGKKVYDFPLGNLLIFGAVADLVVTKSAAGVDLDAAGDFGVGTVTASNNATLSSTEQNIIPTTETLMAAGSANAKGMNIAAIAPLDGTATAIDLFLNFLVDDGDQDVTSTPTNLIVNGTLVVNWINLGDK